MKKVFIVVLALLMIFTLAACKTEAPAPEPEAPAPAPAPAPSEPEAPAEEAWGGLIPKPNQKYKIVFTMFNGQNPVARDIETGFVKAADSCEGLIELWVMDNELDPIVQNANVDMAIMAGDVDFYVLYTNQIESNPQLATKLYAAGIPMSTIGTAAIADTGEEAPLFFSATDNYDSAFEAARLLAQTAKDKGWTEEECYFLSMGFLEAGGVFLIRTQGALDGFKSVFPNVETLGNYNENSSTGDPEVAHQRTADVLTTLGDKKLLMWTHSDDVTATMIAAVDTAGRKADGLIVSNGLSLKMLPMLKSESDIFVGTVDLSFQEWGTLILTQVVDFLNDGTPMPAVTNSPWKIVTPQNVDEYYPGS